MGFLSNRSVNYLNVNNGLVEILNQIMLLFGATFLYQHGLSIAQVLFTWGAISCGRIACRFLAFPLIGAFGLQKTVSIGLAGFGAAIALLSQVQGIDAWFLAFVCMFMLFNPIYWVCFHIYYTLMGEEKHRGKQYAMRGVIILSGQAIFPLFSAAFIKWFGYTPYFLLAVPITALSLFFLLRCPGADVPKRSWVWLGRQQIFSIGVKSGISQSFYESVSNNLWIFITFLFFSGKLVSFGSVIAFGIIMQILCQLFIGHRFDGGHAGRITYVGGVMMSSTILGRALAPLSWPVILFLEIFNAVARLHVRSVVEIVTYNDSHRAGHIVWYWVFTETARDCGNILGTWSAALLLYYGFDLRAAVLIALPALALLWMVLSIRLRKMRAVSA